MASEEGSGLSLVNKANFKSSIWRYFGFVPDANGKPANTDEPVCKLCRTVAHTKTGNTFNLRSHLLQKHPNTMQSWSS